MKFAEIYNAVIKHWGKNVTLTDVVINKSSYYFPKLSQLHSSVEDVVGHENPWDELMVWTMFQVFHEEAIQCFNKNKKELFFQSVQKEKIQNKFYENLISPTSDYHELLPQYENPDGPVVD